MKELAQQHGPEIIKELARLALKAKSEQARVAAIKELLDRGYGKASAQLEVSNKHYVIHAPEPAPDAKTWLEQRTSRLNGNTVQ